MLTKAHSTFQVLYDSFSEWRRAYEQQSLMCDINWVLYDLGGAVQEGTLGCHPIVHLLLPVD